MNGTSRARAWLILLALAGGVLVFQLVERTKGWTARSRAEQLGKELLAAETPEQATAIARELGALDEAAVEPLVRGLVSEEPLISAAAGEEISRRLGAWRKLPRKTSGTKVAALVRELAKEREAIPPEQHLAVRRWAEVIVLWPLQGSGVDAAAVLADCEAILELPEPDQALVAERLAKLTRQKETSEGPGSPLTVETPDNVSSGDVPPEETATMAPIVSAKDVLPMRTRSEALTEAEPVDSTPLPLHPREPRGIYVPRARQIEDAAAPREPETLPPGEPSLLPPVKAAAEADDLSSVPALEIMQDLQSDDPAAVSAAEKELARRGYKASHLSLARQLTNSDPAVRLKLIQSLPKAPGIDPRPWLLHLSEDSDEGVRSAALSILRTSQDPELLQKLR
jgi:hypothetical protein